MELITGKTGLPHVYASDDAEIYRLFLGSGDIVLPTGNQLSAAMQGANAVRIYDGSLITQGRLAKIRPSSGFDLLTINTGIVGQKRMDLVVAEYSKNQETPIEAYIVGEDPLAVDWLSLTSGGSALTPIDGKLYKLMNTSGTYTAGTFYRWMGATYTQSVVQELEQCVLKVVQGTYSLTSYVEPSITTGNIDNGDTHQIKLFGVKLDGINFDSLVDYRVIMTDSGLDLFTTWAKALVENIGDIVHGLQYKATQTLTGEVTSATVTPENGANSLEYSVGNIVEVYLNGLRLTEDEYSYSATVGQSSITVTFTDTLTCSGDVLEVVVW